MMMSQSLTQLYPQEVWSHFYRLTQIPRPSRHEDMVRTFVMTFGNSLGLESFADEIGNVIIRKPATPGMENRKGVILQAHLDMVPQKNQDKLHNFTTDPLEPIIDGEWVRANGTTLGADNGMGVAAALAVLESTGIEHGPLEVLLTTDEETGMTGAFGLKPGVLKGEILLNLDSEDEGELFIGCAGGSNGMVTFSFTGESVPPDYTGLTINVSGLKGGHSGLDIHLGRGNANKIMNRMLYHGTREYGVRLASIHGGSLRNALPRESVAVVALPSSQVADYLEEFSRLASVIHRELSAVEPGLKIEAVPAELPATVIDQQAFMKLLHVVYASSSGVLRMSDQMPGVVETSNNLALVRSGDGLLRIEYLLRSSVDSARSDLKVMIKSLAELAGGESFFDGDYPGWKPNPDSLILRQMQEIYSTIFGRAPKVTAIHAGLECGILGGTYPNLDMISFGPTIRFPHSPDEKVHIASVGKFWELLVATLKGIA